MHLLELVSASPLSATQLASAMGAQPRTVRRILNRLVEDEYLSVREVGRRRVFEPTMRIVALAGQVVGSSHLTSVARPHVELLRARLGATAHLTVPSYESVLCVVHAPEGSDDVVSHPRESVPAHCSAEGRALLAWRDRWRESVLSQPLQAHTGRTVVDPAQLRRALDEVRRDGFAIEDGACVEGRRAVAAPVFLGDQAAAALSVSGPVSAIDLDVVPNVVTAIARRLGDDLHRGSW